MRFLKKYFNYNNYDFSLKCAGKEDAFDSEYDSDGSDRTSASDQSVMEKFLESESNDQISQKNAKNDGNVDEPKSPAELEELPTEPKAKVQPQARRRTEEKLIDKLIDGIDSDADSDVGSAKEKPRKAQSTVGKNLFSNVVKEHRILIPSDDEMSGNESMTLSSGKPKTEAAVAESIDTSMFKSDKKNSTPLQVSRILQSNRAKQSTSRLTPECISVSSDDDFEIEATSVEKKGGNDDEEVESEKRVKRKLLRHDQLADDTKLAQREESDRIKRLDKKNERLSQFIESQRSSQEESQLQVDPNEVLLDFDTKKDERILVHREITKHLKPHQVEGIKFMYDCCYGSVDNLEKFPGSGCILAHCMGLGKTLQLITLLHTVISYPQLKTDKVLVICPKSTVMNWKEEIERWLRPIKSSREIKLFHFPEQSWVVLLYT